jgi:hypothetical protein
LSVSSCANKQEKETVVAGSGFSAAGVGKVGFGT